MGTITEREVLSNIFPELKESEDEEIKKDVKRAISVALDYSYFDKETANNCLAWLEKKSVQKTVDSMQEEPVSKDLKEEIIKQIQNMQGVHTVEDGQHWWKGTYEELEEFARYFAEHSVYGSQAEDLEEAAYQYANCFKNQFEMASMAFIKGAKWQKEQMKKDAFACEVKVDAGGYPYIDTTELYDYEKDIPLAKEGDKVKVIIMIK